MASPVFGSPVVLAKPGAKALKVTGKFVDAEKGESTYKPSGTVVVPVQAQEPQRVGNMFNPKGLLGQMYANPDGGKKRTKKQKRRAHKKTQKRRGRK
jgi:hypothetical protein